MKAFKGLTKLILQEIKGSYQVIESLLLENLKLHTKAVILFHQETINFTYKVSIISTIKEGFKS